jgi:hypothetical protein
MMSRCPDFSRTIKRSPKSFLSILIMSLTAMGLIEEVGERVLIALSIFNSSLSMSDLHYKKSRPIAKFFSVSSCYISKNLSSPDQILNGNNSDVSRIIWLDTVEG